MSNSCYSFRNGYACVRLFSIHIFENLCARDYKGLRKRYSDSVLKICVV